MILDEREDGNLKLVALAAGDAGGEHGAAWGEVNAGVVVCNGARDDKDGFGVLAAEVAVEAMNDELEGELLPGGVGSIV